MSTFAEHFGQRVDSLRDTVARIETMEGLLKAVREELAWYCESTGPVLAKLPVKKAHHARMLLGLGTTCFDTLSAVRFAAHAGKPSRPPPKRRRKVPSFFSKAVGRLWRWLPVVRHRVGTAPESAPVAVTAKIRVEEDAFSARLAELFKTIDHLLKDAEPEGDFRAETIFEEPRSVLLYLQYLVRDSRAQDARVGDLVANRISEIPSLLLLNGIEMREYKEGDFSCRAEASKWFDFRPSGNTKRTDRLSVYPALVKNGMVLQKGLIFEPSSKSGGKA